MRLNSPSAPIRQRTESESSVPKKIVFFNLLKDRGEHKKQTGET